MVGSSRKPASKTQIIAGGVALCGVGALLGLVVLTAERAADVPLIGTIVGGLIALFVFCGGVGLLVPGLRRKS